MNGVKALFAVIRIATPSRAIDIGRKIIKGRIDKNVKIKPLLGYMSRLKSVGMIDFYGSQRLL